jgi:hypothetical protein
MVSGRRKRNVIDDSSLLCILVLQYMLVHIFKLRLSHDSVYCDNARVHERVCSGCSDTRVWRWVNVWVSTVLQIRKAWLDE